jgi:hypothetical protein
MIALHLQNVASTRPEPIASEWEKEHLREGTKFE